MSPVRPTLAHILQGSKTVVALNTRENMEYLIYLLHYFIVLYGVHVLYNIQCTVPPGVNKLSEVRQVL